MPHLARRVTAGVSAASGLAVAAALVATPVPAQPAAQAASAPSTTSDRPTVKDPTAVGKGGAISTVDPEASAAGLKVLKAGGNAVDAAVAAAATLGVTEPYSAGIGGGGYFVYYNAKSGKVRTLDGRETAPMKMPQDAFIDPATGKPYTFTPDLVTSGVERRHARHPRHLGQGAGQLGHAVARRRARAGHQGRAPGVQGRRDVPPADPRQRGALRGVQGHQEALPAQGRRTEGRLDLPQPRARRHLRPDRPARHQGVLPRQAGAAHVGGGAQAAHDQEHRPPRARRLAHRPRPARLQGPLAARREDRATAATTSTAWRRRRPAARPSARRSTSSSATTSRRWRPSRRSTTTSRPARWPTPTAASTSATRPSSTSRPSGSSTTGSPPSGPARSTRRRRRPSRSPAGDVTSYDGVCTARVVREGHDRRRHREHLDHQPHRRRPVGQRRRVHPHHRADRRLGHGRAGSRLPAQQRAHRLLDRVRRRRPQPHPAGQAPAQLDVADDRAQGRQAVPGPRLARRLDDHHDRAADAGQPHRPRHDASRRPSRRRAPPSATPPA